MDYLSLTWKCLCLIQYPSHDLTYFSSLVYGTGEGWMERSKGNFIKRSRRFLLPTPLPDNFKSNRRGWGDRKDAERREEGTRWENLAGLRKRRESKGEHSPGQLPAGEAPGGRSGVPEAEASEEADSESNKQVPACCLQVQCSLP